MFAGFLALCLACPAGAWSADWQTVATSKSVSLGHGTSFCRTTLKGPREVILQVVTFEADRVRLEVAAQGTKEEAVTLAELARSSAALAGCNGGYFDPGTFAPAGLQVVRGQATGRYLPFGKWGGGAGIREGKPAIWTEAEILLARARGDFEHFVQCSPILVNGAVKFSEPGEDVGARRTFLACDTTATKWAMGVTGRMGLRELAGLLASQQGEAVLGFAVHRALNLDGGPSSALWCRDERGREVYEKEGWAVKNGLMIYPRP
jgi:hypothetical protein